MAINQTARNAINQPERQQCPTLPGALPNKAVVFDVPGSPARGTPSTRSAGESKTT
ncbi:hypothetical protein [Sorangium sp. So ce145]|uniref:hypothetical protein n=1 Tax=Sorangium sp. So ce145 TaxID=3133285 RepID=UPI003F613AAD